MNLLSNLFDSEQARTKPYRCWWVVLRHCIHDPTFLDRSRKESTIGCRELRFGQDDMMELFRLQETWQLQEAGAYRWWPQAFLEDTDLCHWDAFSSTEVSGAKAYISSSILLLASRRCSAEDGYRALGGWRAKAHSHVFSAFENNKHVFEERKQKKTSNTSF